MQGCHDIFEETFQVADVLRMICRLADVFALKILGTHTPCSVTKGENSKT